MIHGRILPKRGGGIDEGSSEPAYPGAITRVLAKEIERNTEATLIYLATLARNELSLFETQVLDASSWTLGPDVPILNASTPRVTRVPALDAPASWTQLLPAPDASKPPSTLLASPSSAFYLVLSNLAFQS